MYVIMLFLLLMVGILAYIKESKPPATVEPVVAAETEQRAEREIMFNITPAPNEEPDFTLPLLPESAAGPVSEDGVTTRGQLMYATSAVNVRAGDSTDHAVLGGLSSGQEVRVIGQSDETQWYKIEFQGGEGFVSNNYLESREQTADDGAADEPDAGQDDDSSGNDDDGETGINDG